MTAAVDPAQDRQPRDQEDRQREREQDKIEVAEDRHEVRLLRRLRRTRDRGDGNIACAGLCNTFVTPHTHDHPHDHGHTHAVSADADRRWLALALAIVVGFMGVEVVAGILASSLALLSDAAHMLTDAGAIGARARRRAARGAPAGRARSRSGSAARRSCRRRSTARSCSCSPASSRGRPGQRLVDPPEVEGAIVIVVGVGRRAGERRRRVGARRAPSGRA